MTRVFLLLFLFGNLALNDCAKILSVFPTPSYSHQAVFRSITEELIRRGHEVTVATPIPAYTNGKSPANLTEIDLHDVSHLYKDQVLALADNTYQNNEASHIGAIYTLFNIVFDSQLGTNQMKKLINDKKTKYDLLLLEACSRVTLALSHVFKAPVVQISSLGSLMPNNIATGSPIHPIYYPTSLYHRKVFKLTFWKRIETLYKQYKHQRVVDYFEVLDDQMLKKHFGPDLPNLRELHNNIDMLLLNVHPIWENNRPVSPNVVYLGGLSLKPNKELPKDLKSYLDSSKQGVIFISFGTNVDPATIPSEKIQVFLNVISQLPYDVIWKWYEDEMPGKPDNLKIGKWFPQPDLLKHPKVKLFITQGGLQSTDEAIIAGVPLIGIPMLADQWFNVDKYVETGIGARLDLNLINEDNLMQTIKTVIENESYRENVIKLRSLMYDQPQTALERAIYWLEYVIRHGGARHLRSPAANVSWMEYYQLDIIGVLFLILIVAVVGVYHLVTRLFKSKVLKAKKNQ